MQRRMAMILHKFNTWFVKFPSCYYVIDFFEVVTDFTALQLSPHFLKKILVLNFKKNKPLHPSKLCGKFR